MSRRTGNRWIALCVGGVLAAAASASGQAPGWNVELIFAPGQTGITPETPSCIVRVSARFSPLDYAFATARWNVAASDGDWSQNVVLQPLRIGQYPGVISG